jgi:hypothetical protein
LPRFHYLSPEELAAKRVNVECYFCTEKFMPDHKCAFKGLFLLEMDDDIEVDTAANELGISLYALTGIIIASTMTLVALVDTGCTHSFIKESLLPQLSLEVMPQEGLTVKVANSERVTSIGVSRAAEMNIDSEHFNTKFYVLPLDGFNVILGIQWLSTMGPILWGFDDLKMTF